MGFKLNVSSKFIGILLLLSVATKTNAQEASAPVQQKAHANELKFAIEPLFLLNGALKLDAELHPKVAALSYLAGIEVYRGSTRILYGAENEFGEGVEDKVQGFGLNVAIKYPLRKTKTLTFYTSPGFTFRSLTIKTKGPGFYSYEQGGLTYFAYGQTENSYHVNPILCYGNVGMEYIKNSILTDFFIGLGYKSARSVADLEWSRDFHRRSYGYTYNGFFFQAGIKLGFARQ
jgi:hypothetical protein